MSKSRLWKLATILAIACVVFSGLEIARLARKNYANQCSGKLRLLYMSLYNYESIHGSLPQDINDPDKPCSWRAILLPLGESHYPNGQEREYLTAESWDSPHNRRILGLYDKYACPTHSPPDTVTHYVAITGKGTVWDSPRGRRLSIDRQGSPLTADEHELHPEDAGTIVLVELPRSDIPWTKPKDYSLDEFVDILKKTPQGIFYNEYYDGVLAIDSHGHLRVIDPAADPETIRRMFIIDEASE